MKRKIFIVIVLVLSCGVKAQDTIYFRNGDDIKAKVTEVSDTHIKYYLWNNPNGPVYTKSVNDIFMIRFENGQKEVYTQQQKTTVEQNNNSNSNHFLGNQQQNYMKFSEGNLMLNNRKLTNEQIADLLGFKGYDTYSSAQKQRRTGITLCLIGWFSTASCIGLVLPTLLGGDMVGLEYVGMGLGVIGQTILPIGYILFGVGKGRLNWLAENYNTGGQLSQNVSLSFGPSLVCAPDASGNNNYALGAGIRLGF